MKRKVFRSGNSLVISLPKEILEALQISAGTTVHVELNRDRNQILITPIGQPVEKSGVDSAFASQLETFIEQYRTALEQLAQ